MKIEIEIPDWFEKDASKNNLEEIVKEMKVYSFIPFIERGLAS